MAGRQVQSGLKNSDLRCPPNSERRTRNSEPVTRDSGFGTRNYQRSRSFLPDIFLLLAGLIVAGCGTVYLDSEDEFPRYVDEKTFVSKRGAEMTYRRIYTKLYQCTSGFYRIKGDYDPDSRRGVISVDTGAGLENDLYLATAHIMRITVERNDPKTSVVTIQQTERDDTPYAGVMEGWVNDWREACHV